jgi:hypothetical protein
MTATASAGLTPVWYDNIACMGNPVATGNYTLRPAMAGTYTYWVIAGSTVTGECSAPHTEAQEVTLLVNEAPVASDLTVYTNYYDVCSGVVVNMMAFNPLGWTVVWYDNAACTGGSSLWEGNTYTITATTSSTYWVVVRHPDTDCETPALDAKMVVVNVKTGADAGNISLPNPNFEACYGSATTLTATAVPQGQFVTEWYSLPTLGSSYLDYGDNYGIDPVTTSATYWVAAKNVSTGCVAPISAAQMVTLTVNDNPSAPELTWPTPPDPFCDGGSVTLTATVTSGTTTSMTYIWYNNGVPIPGETTDTYVVTVSGTYTVVVLNSNGCTSLESDQVSFTVHPRPSKPIIMSPVTGLTSICAGSYTELRAIVTGSPAAATYVWYYGTPPTSYSTTSDIYTVGGDVTPGTYSYYVLAYSAEGCASSDTSDVKDVVVVQPPIASVIRIIDPFISDGPIITVRRNLRVEFEVIDPTAELARGVQYQWVHNDIDLIGFRLTNMYIPRLEWSHEGIYKVRTSIDVTVGGECTALSNELQLIIDSDIRIPNVLTPGFSGDKDYDIFKIENIDLYESVELIIVNRWSNEVYRSSNYCCDATCDRCFTGSGLVDGTYFYRLILKSKDGQSVTKSGYITLRHSSGI